MCSQLGGTDPSDSKVKLVVQIKPEILIWCRQPLSQLCELIWY